MFWRNEANKISADGESNKFGHGTIGSVYQKFVAAPTLGEKGPKKSYVVKKYSESRISFLENSINVYEKLKSIGVKNIANVFKKISRDSILMSDFNDGGMVTFACSGYIDFSVLDNFRSKVLDGTGEILFEQMLDSIASDVRLATENGVVLTSDAFFISVPLKDRNIKQFKFYIGDLDVVYFDDESESDSNDLLNKNLYFLCNSIILILNKIFNRQCDKDLLKKKLLDWVNTNFSVQIYL